VLDSLRSNSLRLTTTESTLSADEVPLEYPRQLRCSR
jgi:hypothetical protein